MNAEHLAGPFAMAAMPARLALEPGDWANAAALPLQASGFPQVAAITYFARGLGMVRSGQSAEAAHEVMALSALRDALLAQGSRAWAQQVGIQRDSVAALIMAAAGEINGGLAQLERAALSEDGLAKSVVEPGPIARVVGVLDQTGELTPWGEDRLLVIGSRCGVFDIALGTILIALGTILPPLFIGWDDVSRGRSICVPGRNQYIPRSANEPD